MDGLLSQNGRSWVKVDGHSTKSGRSLGINLSIKVDGPKVSNWTDIDWTPVDGPSSGRFFKWTVARKWTVLYKVDVLELHWTVV